MRKVTITRTITVNDVQFLVYDKQDSQVHTFARTIPGATTAKEIEKICRASVECDPNTKFIDVVNIETRDELRGMDLDEFYAYSRRMD